MAVRMLQCDRNRATENSVEALCHSGEKVLPHSIEMESAGAFQPDTITVAKRHEGLEPRVDGESRQIGLQLPKNTVPDLGTELKVRRHRTLSEISR